jgi:hypothetical protein
MGSEIFNYLALYMMIYIYIQKKLLHVSVFE